MHPATGPVFSGPRQHSFFCETTAFGLAQAKQPDCSAPTRVTYQYRNTAGWFLPLPDPAARPGDLATATATVGGRAVPYVVRLETGTIDRGVYQIAALTDGTAPSPVRSEPTWNGALVYPFGGGCNGSYRQGNSTGGVLQDLMLSQGYAVASSSLNVLDQNCSTMLSAEAGSGRVVGRCGRCLSRRRAGLGVRAGLRRGSGLRRGFGVRRSWVQMAWATRPSLSSR